MKNNTLLTRKDVAERLQISLVTLSKWVKEGKIKAYKIGRIVRFKADEIDRFLEPLSRKN
jgi:excisionase family DNA binding protein